MITMEQLRSFLELVAEMRQAQRDYFAQRDYTCLQKSKALEKRVDAAIVELRRFLYGSSVTQTTFNFPD